MECSRKEGVKKKVKFVENTGNTNSSLTSKLENCSLSKEDDKTNINCENVDQSKNEDCICSCSRDKSDENRTECCNCERMNNSATSNKSVLNISDDQTDSNISDDQTDSNTVRKSSIRDPSDKSVVNDLTIDNVDLIRFLLPGLCHMTAEDSTRQILLDNGLHSILSSYFCLCGQSLENDLDTDDLVRLGRPMFIFLYLLLFFKNNWLRKCCFDL